MKPILVGYGTHEHATAALRWAAQASATLNRPLEVVSVFEPTFAEIAPEWFEEQLTQRREQIEAQARDAGAGEVDIHLLQGEPVPTFTDFAHSDRNRLVVVGAHSHHGPGELGSGVPAHSLLHHLHSPLAVIHDSFEPLAGGLLLVGVDGSEANAAALRWAVEVAGTAGGQVLAVHAFDPNNLSSTLAPGEHPNADRIRAETDAVTGTPVELLLEEAHPVAALIDVAQRRKVAAIVVGTRGHGGFAGLRTGHIPRELIDHSPTPVVIVPHG